MTSLPYKNTVVHVHHYQGLTYLIAQQHPIAQQPRASKTTCQANEFEQNVFYILRMKNKNT